MTDYIDISADMYYGNSNEIMEVLYMGYLVTYEGQRFELEADKCSYFVNDEETPIEGVNPELILAEMAQSDEVYFEKVYFVESCEVCQENRKEGAKNYGYLEAHFYLFSKEGRYVMSSLSSNYEKKALPALLKSGEVDGGYLVSVNVCDHCGDYTIDMEFGLW